MTIYSAFHWAEKARKYAETIGTIFNVRGRVDTVANLPQTGNKVGDLYLVGLSTDTDLAEYAWLSFDNVTRWEKLGSTATSLAFSGLTGSPYDNTSLKNALDAKQDALPDQTSQSGKYLTTNGTTLSWSTVDALPSQSGQSGKYLTTNGSNASWATLNLSSYAPINSPALTGTPTCPTPGNTVNTQQIINAAFIANKFQTVSSLPASPENGVFYFVTG